MTDEQRTRLNQAQEAAAHHRNADRAGRAGDDGRVAGGFFHLLLAVVECDFWGSEGFCLAEHNRQ